MFCSFSSHNFTSPRSLFSTAKQCKPDSSPGNPRCESQQVLMLPPQAEPNKSNWKTRLDKGFGRGVAIYEFMVKKLGNLEITLEDRQLFLQR